MTCCNEKDMVDLGPLLKIEVPKPEIKPVGITPAITVDGKIATQTQGRGTGIFRDVINTAAILYSTVKGATSTPSTVPAAQAGAQIGTGNFQETQEQATASRGGEWFLVLFLAFVAGKLLKWF
jgi:hypothetical protein